MKQYTNAIIFGIAIVASSIFLGKAYTDRSKADGEIRVTGLGKTDFSSDLIVWEGEFSAQNKDLKQSYLTLEKNKAAINEYLVNKGIKSQQLIYSAVKTDENFKRLYSSDGKFIGEEFVGYELTQTVKIESNDVDKIEKVSREITELLNQGVQFYSESPRYYYTKLADLKIQIFKESIGIETTLNVSCIPFSLGKINVSKAPPLKVLSLCIALRSFNL